MHSTAAEQASGRQRPPPNWHKRPRRCPRRAPHPGPRRCYRAPASRRRRSRRPRETPGSGTYWRCQRARCCTCTPICRMICPCRKSGRTQCLPGRRAAGAPALVDVEVAGRAIRHRWGGFRRMRSAPLPKGRKHQTGSAPTGAVAARRFISLVGHFAHHFAAASC